MDTRSRTAAMTALIFGAVAIGFAPILMRLTETGPAAAAFWRLTLALPLLTVFAFRGAGGAAALRPNRAVILAGVFFACDLGFWHYSVALTSVANSTVLANLTPIVVTIAGWWLFRERPARAFLIGLALGIAGAATMALAHHEGAPIGRDPHTGDIFALITTLFYAGYFLSIRAARGRYGTGAVMFWSSLIGAVLIAGLMLALGEQVIPSSAAGWAACAGLAAVHVFGQGAIALALGRLPAATASVVVLIQPAIAALLGWLLFAEAIVPMQGLGAIVALTGVAIAQWASARNENGRRSRQEPAPAVS
ncbi:MAG TPA: DMT family transporter [Caulobacteraceae bacterium]